MKNYEVKAIIETGAECVDIIPDDSEIMADSVEEAIDCVICDLMEQATYTDYNAERYDNYKLVIYDQNNNIICVYRFKARLTFDNKEIEGAEWEEPEYCDTVTETTEEAKKDIVKKYEAEGLTEAGQWVILFNDLIDNAETDTDALHVARERMLKKGLDVSVRVRAYYYNRITGEGCYSHSWTEQPKAKETAQTTETQTAETTQPIYGPLIAKNITFSDAFHRATKSTPPPPIISTRKGVTGVTIREHRQYNNGIEKIFVHKGFYNFDELISWYQHNDPSFLCTYKGILFGCDNIDYYAASFIYESEYL